MAVGRGIAAGDLVAGYQVGALAGRGGMGEVYRALDLRLERPVALKLLSERLSEDEGFRDRLLRESRLAASLDHPNVVPIYEAGEADGRLFIAMRYVDGTDLKALLRREGALAPERAVAIAAQIADALDAAHGKGLVHRDVKPSNILVDQQGGREHAYLADFGLTQSVSDAGPTDGQLMGTVDYVAPEQIRGDQVDGRADVYALGCLLFETLTGTLPFSGASDVAVVYAHLETGAAACERAATRHPARARRRARAGDGKGSRRPAAELSRARDRDTNGARARPPRTGHPASHRACGDRRRGARRRRGGGRRLRHPWRHPRPGGRGRIARPHRPGDEQRDGVLRRLGDPRRRHDCAEPRVGR